MATYDPEDIVEKLRKRATVLGTRGIMMGIAGALLLIFLWST